MKPVCVTCVLNEEEAIKYKARYYRGQIRPLLQWVVGNIWTCPRCQQNHYERGALPLEPFLG